MKLLVNLKNVYVEYNGKEVLNIDKLQVFDHQRIGLIGNNGSGKSTLLKVILGLIDPDEGIIQRFGDFQYVNQVETHDSLKQYSEKSSMFDVKNVSQNLSGGESTRVKLSNALSVLSHGIIADEPTSFLDEEGVELLITQFKYYYGTLLVVSHDRYFLDEVVNTIWELSEGKITVYDGNYTMYLRERKREEERLEKQIEIIRKKKNRLEKNAQTKRVLAQKATAKTARNKRNNNTKDAGRLSHQKDAGTREKKLYQAAKSIEQELDKLDVNKQVKRRRIEIKTPETLRLNNAFPISGRALNKSFGDIVIFDDANFDIPLNCKVAITGLNGSGKTTLLNMIMRKEDGITVAPNVKIGVFLQYSHRLNHHLTVFEYLQSNCDKSEREIRAILHRIGFDSAHINKQLQVLSGGEIMKLTLTKLMMEPYNILLLDEPTNFLDIESMQVIEQLLLEYDGTVVFVSHDKQFVKNVADVVYDIKNYKIKLL